MPITAVVDEATGWLYSQATGILSCEEAEHHLRKTRGLLAPGRPELFDARGAHTDLTPGQVQALSYTAREMFSRGEFGPTAIVATNDGVYGMARMYQHLTEAHISPIRVFREFVPAEQWLAAQQTHRP